MVMSDPFEYRVQARNPLSYAGFAFWVTSSAGLWQHGLRFAAATVLAVFVLPALWRLAVNPRSGFRIDRDRLEVFTPGYYRIIPLPRVDCVRITGDGDRTSCDITLTDGEGLVLPGGSLFCPTILAREFRSRGIAVVA
jgi:hypothetical protein